MVIDQLEPSTISSSKFSDIKALALNFKRQLQICGSSFWMIKLHKASFRGTQLLDWSVESMRAWPSYFLHAVNALIKKCQAQRTDTGGGRNCALSKLDLYSHKMLFLHFEPVYAFSTRWVYNSRHEIEEYSSSQVSIKQISLYFLSIEPVYRAALKKKT